MVMADGDRWAMVRRATVSEGEAGDGEVSDGEASDGEARAKLVKGDVRKAGTWIGVLGDR